MFVSVGAMRGETRWLHRLGKRRSDFINLVVKSLDIGKKNAREWCTMCPSPESDQKTASFPSFFPSFSRQQ
jgi:hypothetical protein